MPHLLNITYVLVSLLKPAPYNPRKISPEEMDKLKLSLNTYGFVDPAIVQRSTGIIIGGHQRVEAARQLGWTEVPVVYVNIDDVKSKTLNLALNKISGDWDFPKLKDLFVELDTRPRRRYGGGVCADDAGLTPLATQRRCQVRTVLRSKPNRRAAPLNPYSSA
jgi:hypothetical protein